jgi:hypothetical protein
MTPIGEESIMNEKAFDDTAPEGSPAWYERLRERFGADAVRMLTEEELEQNRDHDWCMSQREVREKYPGEVVAVYRQRVWGHGQGHAEANASAAAALEQAAAASEPDVPPPEKLVYVVVPLRFPPDLQFPDY